MAPNPQENIPANDNETRFNKPVTELTGDEVVISGIAGVYPKSKNVHEFMNNLYNKVDMTTSSRQGWPYIHPDLPGYYGKIEDYGRFDATFFKIPHGQAQTMDVMSRKLLENVYSAVFDAGVNPVTLAGSKLGVFVGCAYQDLANTNIFYDVTKHKTSNYLMTGCSKTMLANRISFILDGKGPSYAIDSSCTSSMLALDHAFWAMKTGVCSSAIVAGSCNLLDPGLSINMRRAGFLCMDGKTKCFDKNADGYVRSEAVSVLFLQKASEAKRIYAEIVHIKSKHHISPDANLLSIRKPQDIEELLQQFYSEVNISTSDVEYVETCGTGIAIADANELVALDNVFANNKLIKVGSVISNMGHSEGAAVACALTKVCLAYHKGELPGNLHYKQPHDDIAGISDGRIQVVTDNIPFGGGYTALNSISFSSMNCHALLKGHYKKKNTECYYSPIPRLVLASGRLEDNVSKLFDILKNQPVDAEHLALLNGFFEKDVFGHIARGYIILDTDENNKTKCLSESASHYEGVTNPVWFLYSGMGSQWPAMGAELMQIPTFAASIQKCHNVLKPKGIDLVKIVTDKDRTMFDNILHSFVGIAAMQIGLTDLLKEIGIVPDNIIGHSVGEIGCAYADGCLTTEETILSSYYRGLVSVETKCVEGLMAAVGLSYKQVSVLCPPEIEVACHNSAESATISGPAEIVKTFVEHLQKRNIFAKTVQTANIAYHSKYISEFGPLLNALLKSIITSPKLRSDKWVCSSALQEQWHHEHVKYASADYFTNNLLNNVYFEEAAAAIPDNATIIEIAPHGLMQAIIKRSHNTCTHVPLTNRANPSPVQFLLQAVGKLYEAGLNPKISSLYPKIQYPVSTRTPMLSPLVQWAYNDNWINFEFVKEKERRMPMRHVDMLLDDDDWKYIRGHQRNGAVVFPEAALLVLVWETLAMYNGVDYRDMSVVFESIKFEKELYVKKDKPIRVTVGLQTGSNLFEISEAGVKLASGVIYQLKQGQHIHVPAENNELDKNDHSAATDIYKLLQNKGHLYSDEFQSIVKWNSELKKASIKWRAQWVTFIDALIQFNVLSQSGDEVSVPKIIRQLNIDTKLHKQTRHCEVDGVACFIAAYSSGDIYNTTQCGGVQMTDLRFRQKLVLDNASIMSSMSRGVNHVHKSIAYEDRCSNNIIKVSYAGLSPYDYQNITSEGRGNRRYGMDFSGYNCRGEKVMGLVCEGALTSSLEADPSLLWPVPKHWSLQDAATVPLHYAMAYYCLNVRAHLKRNKKVLVIGGAGALGQAVISLCLSLHCTVFATVSNNDKKLFLLNKFPQLKDVHILVLNSAASDAPSLRVMVSQYTNNALCDHVISCAAGELREQAMKCLAITGFFIDIGFYDKIENNECKLTYFCFGCRTYMGVNLSSIFKPEYHNEKMLIHQLISKGMADGSVRPISSVVYSINEIGDAFRVLTSNKRKGKVLITLDEKFRLTPEVNILNNEHKCSNCKDCDNTDFMTELYKILDIPHNAVIDEDMTLKSLNIYEICLEQIRHLVNKTCEIDMSMDELRGFTFARFKQMSCATIDNNKPKREGLRVFYNSIDPDEIQASEPIVMMPSKVASYHYNIAGELDSSETYLFMVPGFEGHSRIFSNVGDRLKIQAVTLQLTPDLEGNTIPEMADNVFKHIKRTFKLKSKFYILGYSFGVNIALELAALLEQEGHLGVVYCLDSSPASVRAQLDAYLGPVSETELQNIVIRDCFQLISGQCRDVLTDELKQQNDWSKKAEAALSELRPLVGYSRSYQRAVIESVWRRIVACRQYSARFRLSSQLVLIKGAAPPSSLAADYELCAHSTAPVQVLQVRSRHHEMPADPQLPNIVNSMLEPALLHKYDTLNQCEIYNIVGSNIQKKQQSAN